MLYVLFCRLSLILNFAQLLSFIIIHISLLVFSNFFKGKCMDQEFIRLVSDVILDGPI
jgi:hypothetical protein